MEKVILNIFGMHCASCSAIIENALKKKKGVFSINVNFASEKAYLDYNPDEINIERIQKIIEKLGYRVKEERVGQEAPDHHKEEKIREIKKLKTRFITAFIFGLPIIY